MGVSHSQEVSILDYIREEKSSADADDKWSHLSLSTISDVKQAVKLLRRENVPNFGGTMRAQSLEAIDDRMRATRTGASSSRAALQMQAGSRVQLAEGWESVSDAQAGPLKPGDIGTITSITARTCHVKAPNGSTWWYQLTALRIAHVSGPLGVGCKVVLRKGYETQQDASDGPLSPGQVGEIVSNDGSGKPWKVKSESGKTW